MIGVGGPARTSIEGLAVECESGTSLSGFTLVNSGDMTSAAMITARGAEIRGNVLFHYGAVDGIAIQDALPSGEVPLQLALSPGMCGVRVQVQALVLDLSTLEGYLTNAMSYTTR